ncbi:MAG: hypothetical protein IKL65_03090 [Bacilli bacterium]|nr:hypothetical protein [Bacilli bacterium]
MKKNGQYVGVDEKYIPEEEKYVDNSINEEVKDSVNDGIRSIKNYVTDKDNQEKFTKTGKKGLKVLKGLGIGYLSFIAIVFIFIIVIFVMVFSRIFTADNHSDKISEGVNDVFDKVMEEADKQKVDLFNSSFELYVGTKSGFRVGSLLDKVSTNNKKEANHVITVVHNDITTTVSDEIVSIKQSLESTKNYEVSFDYDSNGFIKKVTIK